MQFEPHRVAVTRNADLTIRFLDISVQLLIPTPPSPFTSAFPRPLPLLSIDIFALAGFPEVAAHLPSNFVERARIDDVQLAIESLEVGIVLGGGEVLVYRMADRQAATARQLPDKPYFLVKAESPATAFAISDVGEHPGHVDRPFCLLVSPGFASVAYTNGSLIVIDMRSPRVILEVGKAQQTSPRHSLIHRHSPGVDPVFSLAWTISGVKSGKSSL
jgi:syntaxin-binding protein 5